jgi:Tfp pilus assembly PilM family ATPase
MFRFFSTPCLGLEITAKALKLGILTTNDNSSGKPLAKEVPLPVGMVGGDSYASPNIKEREGLASLLQETLQEFAPLKIRKLALSLADTIFRVQNLEFDELPAKTSDRDRLVRWRVEKGAAFDATNTVLRYQVAPRQGRGFSVLACLAKLDVLAQYEDLLDGLGYDTWSVGPASFHALNFYSPSLQARGVQGFAFVWVTDSSYSVLVTERGVPRFYRCKEIRQGATDARDRMLRELEDSLHFYTHLDRQQSSEVGHLFLAGDTSLLTPLAQELHSALTMEVKVLALHETLQSVGGIPDSFSSVFGAGGAV